MALCVNGHTNEDSFKFCQECGASLLVDRSLQVYVSLEPPVHGRVSVFFRGLLAVVPTLIGAVMGIGVFIVVIGAWFTAVFTGKVPDRLHGFVARWVDYQTRVRAYSHLVTARYPDALNVSNNREITTTVTSGPLKRSAALFRIVLAIPAALLNGLTGMATFLMAIVMWFWALFTTKTPRSLHQATATLIRYQSRFAAYYYLLTPEQPWHGFRGEGQAETQQPTSNQWALTKGARRAIIVSTVLGGLLYIGLNVGFQIFMNSLPKYEYYCVDSEGYFAGRIDGLPQICPPGSDEFKIKMQDTRYRW